MELEQPHTECGCSKSDVQASPHQTSFYQPSGRGGGCPGALFGQASAHPVSTHPGEGRAFDPNHTPTHYSKRDNYKGKKKKIPALRAIK